MKASCNVMIMCLFSIPPNLNGLALMISLQVFLLYVHSSTNYGIFTVKICYPIGYILYIQQIFVHNLPFNFRSRHCKRMKDQELCLDSKNKRSEDEIEDQGCVSPNKCSTSKHS